MACGGSLVSMVLVWVLLPTKTKKSDTQARGVQDKQEGKINYLSYVVLTLHWNKGTGNSANLKNESGRHGNIMEIQKVTKVLEVYKKS